MYRENEQVVVSVNGCVGTIVINRSDHDNAITQFMIGQLIEAFDDLYRERKVRAIVLTGAGEVFSSGMEVEEMMGDAPAVDLAQMPTPMPTEWGDEAVNYRDLILRMLETTKPIIAAVNGPALAGGAGLAVASDIVIASTKASFGLTDPRRGLVAGVVAPLLCFRIGASQASRLLLTSETIDAKQAGQIGIFHELVPPDLVWARAAEIANQCAAGSPEAIQLTKRVILETAGEQLETQLSAGAAISATIRTTENAREGMAAYLGQRPPKWK